MVVRRRTAARARRVWPTALFATRIHAAFALALAVHLASQPYASLHPRSDIRTHLCKALFPHSGSFTSLFAHLAIAPFSLGLPFFPRRSRSIFALTFALAVVA